MMLKIRCINVKRETMYLHIHRPYIVFDCYNGYCHCRFCCYYCLVLCLNLLPVDFDECQSGLNCCEQTCSNRPGGYQCSCHPGFALRQDNCSCTGAAVSNTSISFHFFACKQPFVLRETLIIEANIIVDPITTLLWYAI